MTMTSNTAWLNRVATFPDLPPNALRVAVAVATTPAADVAALADRLGFPREEADAAVAALVAAGFARLRLEPTTPPAAPGSIRLTPAARRALEVLRTLGPPCHVSTWRRAFDADAPSATADAARMAFGRARRALAAAGLVSIDEDGVVTVREVGR